VAKEPSRDYSLIVIGASAGGIDALAALVKGLPADLPAAVCVVMHFPAYSTSRLPEILNRAGPLHAEHVTARQTIQPGCIYIAPPNWHLLAGPGHLFLSGTPGYNSIRPAIDPLFRTAAHAYGARCIGVLLSGTLDDGVAGLAAIKAAGGLAIVQDPKEALFDDLPRAAMRHVAVDFVLPAAAIGTELSKLTADRAAMPAPERGALAVTEDIDDWHEAQVVANDKAPLERGERPDEPSMFTCPDCGGVLWELRDHDLLRYRCHVGHVYTAEGLRVKQHEALEEALWTAFRTLEESAALARRLAHRAEDTNSAYSANHFIVRAADYETRAQTVRAVLDNLSGLTEPGGADK
jgi:two-component system chemotaxis response regulator CheB